MKLKQFLWVGILVLCAFFCATAFGQPPELPVPKSNTDAKIAKMEKAGTAYVAQNVGDSLVLPAYPDPNTSPSAYLTQLYAWVLALVAFVLGKLGKFIPIVNGWDKYLRYVILGGVAAFGFYQFGWVSGFTAFVALVAGLGGMHLGNVWVWIQNLFRRGE